MKKIIILGASGYIGQRLIKKLLQEPDEYELHLFSRNKRKLSHFSDYKNIYLYDTPLDHSSCSELNDIFKNTHTVFYLIHSMSEEDNSDFMEQEKQLALFIRNLSDKQKVGQIVYLGGLGADNTENLSTHLKSRQQTGSILREGNTPVVEFRAGVIIGAGGSSFEIIRTLATKLPFIPVFFKKEGLCETIFVDNVVSYLKKTLIYKSYQNKILEIGNGEQKAYSQLVQEYAKVVLNRKLFIINLSFLSFLIGPQIIGRVIAFMTGQPKELIIPLIYGVKNDAIVTPQYDVKNQIPDNELPPRIVSLDLAYKLAADRQYKGKVISVWDVPTNLSKLKTKTRKFFSTQEREGLLFEERYAIIKDEDKNIIFNEIVKIGSGNSKYWSPHFLWQIRGFIDKVFGGAGIGHDYGFNRNDLHVGDRIDFWTVEEIKNSDDIKELRLIAEMKTPGEAWLQFKIVPNSECPNTSIFYLRAFFEPKGIAGYLYWYSLYIIHKFIFSMMINNIIKNSKKSC